MFGKDKINDPYNTMGIASATPSKPARASQVGKLLAAKRAYDRGQGTADELLAIVQDSTGYEINEAMDRSGQGTASWARAGRPTRGSRR